MDDNLKIDDNLKAIQAKLDEIEQLLVRTQGEIKLVGWMLNRCVALEIYKDLFQAAYPKKVS